MDHYQVKFELQGKTIYGICEHYDDEAKAAKEQGEVIVSDAVLPIRYRVPKDRIVDIPMEIGRYNWKTDEQDGADEFHRHVVAECKKAQQRSDRLSAGVQVGALFSLGVGDGQAWYVVTKVGKKTCRVEWRGFCLDRNYDHHFGSGGSFAIADVDRYVKQERAGRKLTRG